MASAKLDLFPEDTVDMAAFAAALSHPARIALLKYLLAHPGCRCSDLVESVPLSQPSCSRHLTELRKAGLVTSVSHRNEVRCSLNHERVAKFCDAFQCNLKPKTS
jgi:DNA-binding transcriptional ArsR family regulator